MQIFLFSSHSLSQSHSSSMSGESESIEIDFRVIFVLFCINLTLLAVAQRGEKKLWIINTQLSLEYFISLSALTAALKRDSRVDMLACSMWAFVERFQALCPVMWICVWIERRKRSPHTYFRAYLIDLILSFALVSMLFSFLFYTLLFYFLKTGLFSLSACSNSRKHTTLKA